MQENWIKIEDRMPQALTQVLVLCEMFTSKGFKRYVSVANYIEAFTVAEEDYAADDQWGQADYDEEKDQYFAPAGWYEIENESDKWWLITEEVLAWMPLPSTDIGPLRFKEGVRPLAMTEDFYYMVDAGGWAAPEKFLVPQDAAKVRAAIETLKQYEQTGKELGIFEEI